MRGEHAWQRRGKGHKKASQRNPQEDQTAAWAKGPEGMRPWVLHREIPVYDALGVDVFQAVQNLLDDVHIALLVYNIYSACGRGGARQRQKHWEEEPPGTLKLLFLLMTTPFSLSTTLKPSFSSI